MAPRCSFTGPLVTAEDVAEPGLLLDKRKSKRGPQVSLGRLGQDRRPEREARSPDNLSDLMSCGCDHKSVSQPALGINWCQLVALWATAANLHETEIRCLTDTDPATEVPMWRPFL